VFEQERLEERLMTVETLSQLPIVDDTRRAFDGVAPIYDRANRENPILEAMRRRTIAAISRCALPGARLLDLGCGPGADAEALAARGAAVTAIDCSPAMASEARRRIQAAGLEDLVTVHTLGIHELDRLRPATFDIAYSNFGPLNCVPSLVDAARLLADRIRPGGFVIASVIGRICPWEIALYVFRRDWTRVRVRFARAFVAVPLNGRTVWTRYYTPGEFQDAFAAAGFELVSLSALGLFTPPPYMQAFAERHPRCLTWLLRLDETLGRWPVLRAMGDHFLIVLRKA
jgi:SAM-dependent methyltransferase